MDLPRREGEFINVVELEDVRKALASNSAVTTEGVLVDTAENSEYVDPIDPDVEFMNELRAQDLRQEIRKVTKRRLQEQWHADDALPEGARNRSYRHAPNVDAFAVEKSELQRLAAASHGSRAVVTNAVPVGLWYYEKCDTTCVFCYEQLMGPCHKCLSDETPASECKIAIGECGHPIHIDCQNAWSGKNNCMTCQQAWRVRAELSVYGEGLSI